MFLLRVTEPEQTLNHKFALSVYSELTGYVQIINDLFGEKSKSTGSCDLNDNRVNGGRSVSQHLFSL